MKTFTKYLLLPLCCLFMAAGCGKDDLPTGEQPEGPGSETGILSFENWDLTVADDMEILPTDNAPGTSSTRSTVDAPDDYIVKIYNSKKEQVGSYTYAEIKTTGNIELPQDSYTVTAESPNYASTPDVAWETPVYYGEISVNVIKKLTTTVNNLVCKLGNIKATVGLSADLDSLFKPDDETDKLTVTLSIQDNSLVYGRPEATGETLKPGFFRAVDTDNTLKIVLSGQYNKAGEGEPASYVPVNWSQEIQNVKAGQWRKINIKILHASDGNVQFQVTVETWVYDEKIDVDVMSSFYSYGEEEIPDEEISDENSPAVTLENGDIAQPYPITTSMFDFDVQSCSPMITAVVTPYQGSTVASLEVVFDSDNAQFLEALATARKKPLKVRIRNIIYRYRRKIVEKKVVADSHTLDELVQYAMNTYNLIETNSTERKYIEQQKNLKESLILQHKPEVLGEMKDIPKPDVSNEESVREYFCKIKTRSEMIAEMPDNVIPMNFHLYEIRIGDDSLEMEIDYIWNIFGISYSGNKKVMKQFEKISKDLYIYYGVSEDDIKKKTERYLSLVTALSS